MKSKFTYWFCTLAFIAGMLCDLRSAIGQSVAPALIGSTGNYSTAGFGSISSSVGEPVVTTVSSGTLTLTQGFQQPDPMSTCSLTVDINVMAIAGGGDHSLALKIDGTVWTWGRNNRGQLGDGTTIDKNKPIQVPGLTGMIAIAGGAYHTLALKNDGTLWAWGKNDLGELGDGTNTDRYTPVQVLTGVTGIAAGGYHSLALKSNGTVWTWGANNYGQLGLGDFANRNAPVQISGLTGFVKLGSPTYHSIALKGDGTVWAWGYGIFGQLGDGNSTTSTVPVMAIGINNIISVGGGSEHSLALRSDGTLWAWGYNAAGQLGDNTTTNRPTAVQVKGPGGGGFLIGVAGISPGGGGSGSTSLAVKNDGTAWAWGFNGFGELGVGDNTDRYAPAQSIGLAGIKAVASGYLHSAALKGDGSVWSYGKNDFGQLGDGTFINKNTAVPVTPFSTGICLGQSATLTATVANGTAPFTYLWNPGSATTSSIVVSPTTTTNYTVIATDGLSCGDTAFTTVVVNPLPTPTVTAVPSFTICAGRTDTLVAAGGALYVWSTGSTNDSIFVSPTANTGYDVTVTNASGCTAVDSKTVTVNPLPTPTISVAPSLSICDGSSATLTADGGTTYAWSTGETTSAIIVTPTTSTGYDVTVSNGCTATTSVTVTVQPTPTATATSPVTICNGQAATFTVSVSGGINPYTYAWAPGGETTSSINVTPTAFTSYTATVTSVNGCSDSDITSATVNPGAVVTLVSSNSPVCTGQTLSLSSGSDIGTSYSWTGPAGFTSSLQNPTLGGVAPSNAGTYSVTASSAAGCTGAVATTAVIINPTPTVTISGTNTICNGSNTTLTASGASTYVWSPATGLSSPTIANPVANPTTTITYTVNGTTSGCIGTTTVTLTVNPTPTVSVSPPSATICNGGNTTLTASGATTYAWTPATGLSNPAISNPIANPTATTTYTVNGTSLGCVGTKTVMVTVVQPAAAANAGADLNLCGTPTATTTVTGSSPSPGTGLWTVTMGTASITSPTSATTGVTGIGVGLNTLRWTVSNSPCASTFDELNITVTATPTISVTAGPSFTICNGSATTLNATSTASTYTWALPAGLSNPNIANPVANPTATTTYTVSGTFSGCTGTKTVTVTVNNPPAVPAVTANPNPICSGNTLSLTATSTGATYSWSGPAAFTSTSQNPVISFIGTASSGTYSVTSTSAAGCTSPVGTISVTVNQTPAVPVATNTGPVCIGQPLTLNASSVTGGTSYAWTGPNSYTSSVQNSVVAVTTTAHAGTYSVTASSAAGCMSAAGTTSVTVNQTTAPAAGALDPVLCAGEQLDLTATTIANATYTWTGPGGFTSTAQNPSIPSVTTAEAGTYSVVATHSITMCASVTGTVSITVNPLPAAPTASATPNPVCSGGTLSLNASTVGGMTYQWSGPDGFLQTVQNTFLAGVTSSSAGTYSVAITDGNGCTSLPGLVTVTVNATPLDPAAGSNSPVCEGTTLSLTASIITGATYTWAGPSGFSSSVQDPTFAGITTADAGTYSVIASVNGCTGPAGTTSVVVDAAPTVAAGTDITVCGTTATLTGNAPAVGTGLWSIIFSPSGAITTPTSPTSGVTGLSPGTHLFQWAISNGVCSPSTATVTITVNNPPAAAPTSTNVLCFGSCNGSAIANPSSGTPPYTYLWNDPGTQTTQTANALCAGNYSVTVTDAANCFSTATVTVGSPAALTASLAVSNVSCNGGTNGSATATPSGGTSPYTYSWTGGQSTSTATGLGQGSYVLTLNDANSCSATFTVAINEPAALAVIISPASATVCAGQNVTLDAQVTGGTTLYTYAWSHALGSTQIVTPAPTTSVTYSVAITDANGCTKDASVPITVSPGITASITGNIVYCVGDTVLFTAFPGTGTETYLWSPGAYTTQIVTDLATTAGVFPVSVTVTDAGGCSDTDSISVTVNPGPAITVTSSNNPLCLGASSQLTATGGSNYVWSTGGSTASINVTPTTTGASSYTVTASGGGCTTDSVITLTVNALPTAAINGNTTICSGTNATLTASGGVSYAWNIPSTQNPVVVSPSVSTGYSVTVTDVNGCTDTASFIVNVVTAPTASVTATATTVCAGSSVTISASPNTGVTYAWNTGSTNSFITDTPTSTTTYSVIVSNGGCSDSASVVVTVSSVAAVISGNDSLCIGGSTVLTGTPAGGNAPYTFLWAPGGQATSTISETYTTTGTFNYTVTITDATGCSGTGAYAVLVSPLPTASISASQSSICSGGSVTLTASGGSSYTWLPAGPFTPTLVVSPASSTSYSVVVANGSCSSVDSINITVNQAPVVASAFANPPIVCPGDSVYLNASSLTATGYTWNPGSLPGAIVGIIPPGSGTYVVTITDANNCTNTASVSVTVSLITVNAGPDITICPGFTAQLNAVVSGSTSSVSYLWTPSQYLNDSIIFNPSANPDSTMVFAVEVFNQDGCWAKDSVTVTVKLSLSCVLNFYNGITPNGDNDNEFWWIDGIQSFPDNNVAIFNRWGSKVWSATGYDNKDTVWRGKNDKGESLPDGTYYYVVEIRTADEGLSTSAGWVEVTH